MRGEWAGLGYGWDCMFFYGRRVSSSVGMGYVCYVWRGLFCCVYFVCVGGSSCSTGLIGKLPNEVSYWCVYLSREDVF